MSYYHMTTFEMTLLILPPPPYLIQNMELNIKEGVSFKILLNKQITIVNIFQPTHF